MTWDVATNTNPKARKDYWCDACMVINDSMWCDADFTEEELSWWVTAREEGFKILTGTVYHKTAGFYMGESSVWRCRPLMDDICIKYHLYDE